jgi:predicted ATPase
VTSPAPSSFFYGKAEFVSNLIHQIKLGQERGIGSRSIIHGAGGIGKTSVAIAVLHHPEIKALYAEHIYFTSCEAAVSESLLLKAIASSFNLKHAKNIMNSVLLFIREASSPVFLILDNFETCWFSDHRYEIHQVLKQLAALRNLTLLLTMRGGVHPSEIKWERVPELNVLALSDAQKLFVDIAGLDLPLDPLGDELLQALDCLPLAVTLLAQLVRQGESIKALHRRWMVQKLAC